MRVPLLLSVALFLTTLSSHAAPGSPIPDFTMPAGTRQLILGLAPDWDSTEVSLQRYERKNNAWTPIGQPIPGRLGRSGLAWGIGLHATPASHLKVEGDGRAPAGAFALGGAYGYEPDIARHRSLPYHQVTEKDLWVEDPASPHYNRHLRINHPPRTQWERDQQMRQNDNAHKLKLFIHHNSGSQTRPGLGSSIFFHIWREDGARPSFGCTVMAEPSLRDLIRWVDPTAQPVYILLPREAYQRARAPWNLP